MGCHFLLQEIFPTQRSDPGLPQCRQILYRLSYAGSHSVHDHLRKSILNRSSAIPSSIPGPGEGKRRRRILDSVHTCQGWEELTPGERLTQTSALHPEVSAPEWLDPHLPPTLEFREVGCEYTPTPATMQALLLTPPSHPQCRPSVGVFSGIWGPFNRGSPGMWQEEEMGHSGPANFSRGNE